MAARAANLVGRREPPILETPAGGRRWLPNRVPNLRRDSAPEGVANSTFYHSLYDPPLRVALKGGS